MRGPTDNFDCFNPLEMAHLMHSSDVEAQPLLEPHIAEYQFRQALRGTPVIVFAQDLNLRYTWIHNPVAEIRDEDILGKQDSDFLDCAEEVRQLTEIKRHTLLSGVRQRTAMALQIKGRRRHYDIICDPSRNSIGAIDGIVCTAIDISEQIEGRANLERNNERLNLAIAALNGYIYEQSLKTGYTERGEGIARILGYDAADVQDSNEWWTSLIHPDDRERVVQQAHKDWKEQQSHSVEYRVRHKNGHYVHIWDRAVVVTDEHGQPDRLIGTAIDVSAQKILQERQHFLSAVSKVLAASLDLEQTLDQLTRIVLPDFAGLCVIFLVQEDGTIERAAASHVDPQLELRLRNLQHYGSIDPDGPHLAAQAMRQRRALLNPNMSPELIDMTRPAGLQHQDVHDLVPRSQIVVPLIARERVIGAVCFGITSSERLYNENDLALAEEIGDRAALAIENAWLYAEMQEAVRTRDAFLSIASHELRTPLTVLLGQAQLLERRLRSNQTLDPRNERSIQVLINQAVRLNKLVSALLDVSRLESGQLQIDATALDLNALLYRIREQLEPELAGHTLRLDMPEWPVIVAGDELRLEQVFHNLIQNAGKYSPAGGNIDVSLSRAGDQAVVRVCDEGIGIPAADLPGLFTRFFRASNVTAQHISGVGIGLFVVREIVTLHGGWIEVESVEGQGSTFTVWLPASQ